LKDFIQLVPKFCDGYVYPLQDEDDVESMDMRILDYEETSAATGLISPQSIIKRSVDMSDYTWTVKIQGEIVGVFGLTDAPYEDYGIPWFIGSPKMNRMNPLRFVKLSKRVIDLFHIIFPGLVNFVLADYKGAVEWLRLLGFRFSKDLYTLTDPDERFYMFWKTCTCREDGGLITHV
jgi:hypothetical protein